MVGASRSRRILRLMKLLLCVFFCQVCCLCCCCYVPSSSLPSSSPLTVCPSSLSTIPPPFLASLLSHCHLSSYHHPTSPLEMNGNFLERALSYKSRSTYTAVLFYASWCPFSQNARSTFEVLGSMYPQMDHLAVKQSSAMPSLFSRYGIHSLPAISVVNQTSITRFRGPKDLDSLMEFYKKTTGHEPVQYIAVDQSGSLQSGGKSIMLPWFGPYAKEIWAKEPYLLLSTLFLCLKVVVYLLPRVLFHSRTLWVTFRLHLNLEIFGETRQNLGRILHMIDVLTFWTKVKLCNSRNFNRGARNARVLASSLASVSLGEASTSRL